MRHHVVALHQVQGQGRVPAKGRAEDVREHYGGSWIGKRQNERRATQTSFSSSIKDKIRIFSAFVYYKRQKHGNYYSSIIHRQDRKVSWKRDHNCARWATTCWQKLHAKKDCKHQA